MPITEAVIAYRNPKDDKVLELAANGYADVTGSGDADLLTLNPFLSPATFSRAVIIGPI